jgi:stage II sporulation protein D
VYRGVTGESVRSDAAVSQTSGRTVTFDGVPAVTYYFSTSGGHTENVEYSFVGSLSKPWLVGVPDPYDTQSPYHRWNLSVSASRLDRALGAPGAFRRLKVLQRGVSPRVVRARVVGTAGSRTVTGPQVRAALGLRDTWFTHYRVGSSASRARSARPASWGPRAPGRALAGRFQPAPRKRVIRVERLAPSDDGVAPDRWRLVQRVRTTRAGRYRIALSARGVYRVRYGSVTGPRVRVR